MIPMKQHLKTYKTVKLTL